MKSRKINQQIAHWRIWTTMLLVFLSGCDSNIPPLDAASTTPLASRKEESANISGVEVWRVRTDFPNYGSKSPYPYILDGMVVTSSLPNPKDSHASLLTAYSLSTGQIIWRTKYSDDYGTFISSACVDKATKRLYLIYGLGVGAFDLKTGQQLWQTERLGTRGKIFIDCWGNGSLQVRTDGIYFYAIDPINGKILSMQEKASSDTLVFSREGVNIIQVQKGPRTLAQDDNGQVLWQVESYLIGGPVLFVEGDDILIYQGLPLISLLTRMNYRTGQIIWKTAQIFVSNPVLLDDKVFALTIDGKLSALDVSSGQEIGNVQFDRGFSDVLGEASFFVAAQSPYVVVYFGDTQELVAFKFETQ